VECSGVAEPRKIRDLFQEAEDYGSPLLERIKLDTLVTLVDANIFLELFGTDVELLKHSSLAVKVDDVDGQQRLQDDGSASRKVTELLLEQVECADIILVNKIDLLKSKDDLILLEKVLTSINPTAKLFSCVKGKVDPLSIIGAAKGQGAADFGILDEHRKVTNKKFFLSNFSSYLALLTNLSWSRLLKRKKNRIVLTVGKIAAALSTNTLMSMTSRVALGKTVWATKAYQVILLVSAPTRKRGMYMTSRVDMGKVMIIVTAIATVMTATMIMETMSMNMN
jgi:G3E family GTPase